MSQEHRPLHAPQPAPIDTDEDRMGSVEELHFDKDTPNVDVGFDPTDDDLEPETLIPEDGARSPGEAGADHPADWDLSVVDEDDIGGGNGLDEAELARRDPLDGKREP
ncbi:serine kinase/phosphatase [Pseudomonas vranovensis]|uniref:Serine kinase/phosphatase n=1 Tax=Pseudomonas vranovensis TaxID=321661 RepID=A0A423E0P7_9PSED|nr:serine kinase/phosphatase [Pseudomonas vranovensis]ROL78983.1 serine kinase/phosphatase [Pseudomonas vranovensis]